MNILKPFFQSILQYLVNINNTINKFVYNTNNTLTNVDKTITNMDKTITNMDKNITTINNILSKSDIYIMSTPYNTAAYMYEYDFPNMSIDQITSFYDTQIAKDLTEEYEHFIKKEKDVFLSSKYSNNMLPLQISVDAATSIYRLKMHYAMCKHIDLK